MKDKRTLSIAIKFLPRAFKGFRFTLHDVTAEENRVALTAESHGTHKSGREYNNHYHFLMFIKNDKIERVKEYFDTQHAIWVETG